MEKKTKKANRQKKLDPKLWLETEQWVREALIEGNLDFEEVVKKNEQFTFTKSN